MGGMADLALPADLLPLHIAALAAERAMTTARKTGGDVEAAREEYLKAAADLHSLQAAKAAKAALDDGGEA